jgi:large subunit ribosomal protein L22
MKVKAQSKWVRMGARKIRRVMGEIRGKNAAQAIAELSFLPHKGARLIEKAVKSAVANAKHNFKLDEKNLFISEAYVDEATPFKRFRCGSRGRTSPRRKKQSHVTVFVSPIEPKAKKAAKKSKQSKVHEERKE